MELAGALAEIARQSLARDFRHFDPDVGADHPARRRARRPAAVSRAAPRRRAPRSRAARRRRAHRHARDARSAPGVVRGGRRADRGGDRPVGGRRGGVAARRVARRAARSRRPRARPARPDAPRAPGRLRRRRPRVAGRSRRQAAAGRRAGRDADGRARRRATSSRAIEGQPLRPFHYRNLGNMATIGRASAVADLPVMQLKGWIGWLAWLFVHIFYLIGFRNRLVVMVQWAWSYFSYQRAIRLITGGDRRRNDPARRAGRVIARRAGGRVRAAPRVDGRALVFARRLSAAAARADADLQPGRRSRCSTCCGSSAVGRVGRVRLPVASDARMDARAASALRRVAVHAAGDRVPRVPRVAGA